MTTPITTESPLHLEPTGHDPFADGLAELRELDARHVDGITVRLLWRPGDQDVLVQLDDARTGERFELRVPGGDALLAFEHPFAYAG